MITTPSSGSFYSQANSVSDLSNPPGYKQDHRTSFSDRGSGLDDTIPSYDNASPFYANSSNYPSTISSPVTPTRRGRGILDNDPSLYLRGEGEGNEDAGWWDAAAGWAKAAGKRLSQGEQQLWKMVSAVTNTEDDR